MMYTKRLLHRGDVSGDTSIIYLKRENDVCSSMSSSPELDALAIAARHLSVVFVKRILLPTNSLVDWLPSISN